MHTLLTSFLLALGAVPGLGQGHDCLVADDTLKSKSWFSTPEKPPELPAPPEYPFDRKHIEQYCKYLFYGGQPNTRCFSHGFMLTLVSGINYIQVVGKDQLLGLNVQLYFDDKQRKMLSRCMVHHEDKSYVASDIFQVSLSPKKRIFMISFQDCDTILVVYVSKEHPAWGFWTLPKE